jgi:hypothetical protein
VTGDGAGIVSRVALLACALAAACGRPAEPAALRLATSPAGKDTRLTLVARAGLKINARLPPALELADGTVLRFEGAERTADSAYFTAPPTARLAGHHARVHGTLRASVCGVDQQVCRSITLSL